MSSFALAIVLDATLQTYSLAVSHVHATLQLSSFAIAHVIHAELELDGVR